MISSRCLVAGMRGKKDDDKEKNIDAVHANLKRHVRLSGKITCGHIGKLHISSRSSSMVI